MVATGDPLDLVGSSGVQYESANLKNSGFRSTLHMSGYSWTHLKHATHLSRIGWNPPNRPLKTPYMQGLLSITLLYSTRLMFKPPSQTSCSNHKARRTLLILGVKGRGCFRLGGASCASILKRS